MKTFNICSLALISALYGTGISANNLERHPGWQQRSLQKALPGQSIRLPADHGAHPTTAPSGGISPAT